MQYIVVITYITRLGLDEVALQLLSSAARADGVYNLRVRYCFFPVKTVSRTYWVKSGTAAVVMNLFAFYCIYLILQMQKSKSFNILFMLNKQLHTYSVKELLHVAVTNHLIDCQ